MLSTLKKYKSDKANINQQLYNAIYKKVTKEKHNYPSPQKGDRTIIECIGFFKDGADPNILSELEKSLIGQEKHYDYYINKFLPALKDKVIKSTDLSVPAVFNSEIEQPQGPQTIKGEIVVIILGITNKGNDKNHPNSTIRNQGPENLKINGKKELEKSTETSKLNGDQGSGANSPMLNKKSPLSSPVSSRRGSISTTLSSAEEDDDLQREEIDNQTQPEQPAKKEQNTQENENSGDQANPIGNGNPQKRNEDQPQPPKQNPEEKPKKQENENSEPTKQPNNRNSRTALATCCALSVGCLVAGVVTLGIVGAGLLVMSVVFAIAAAVTRYLTPPSSKLTSTDLSPLINDSKQR
ncbi:MAG: hypothetical protein ACEY3A_04285 [Wolbachia sp.]